MLFIIMNREVHEQVVEEEMNNIPLPKMVKFLKEQPITPQTVLQSHELRLNDLEDEIEKQGNNFHITSYDELRERNTQLEKMLIEQDDKLNEIKDMVLKLQAFMIETNMMVTEAKKQEEMAESMQTESMQTESVQTESAQKEASQAEGRRQLAEKGNVDETEIKLSEEELFKKMMSEMSGSTFGAMLGGGNDNPLAALFGGLSNNSTVEPDFDTDDEDTELKLNLDSNEDIKLEVSEILDGTNSLEKLLRETFESGTIEEPVALVEEPVALVEEQAAPVEEVQMKEEDVSLTDVPQNKQNNRGGGRGGGRGKGGRGRGNGKK